jgi:hypothetical protein
MNRARLLALLLAAGPLGGNRAVAGEPLPETPASPPAAVALCQLLSQIDWPVPNEAGPSLAALDPSVSLLPSSAKGIEIGVLGRDPVAAALADLVRGRSIRGLPLEIVPIEDSIDAACDLVYVAVSERSHLDRVLETLNSAGIPSISTLPEFLSAGGTIEVRTDDDVRILVNGDRLRELGFDLMEGRASRAVDATKEERCLDGWPLRFWALASSR